MSRAPMPFIDWRQAPPPSSLLVDDQPAVRAVEDHASVNAPSLSLIRNHRSDLAIDESGVADRIMFAAVFADHNSGVIDAEEDAVGAVRMNGDGVDDHVR